jgi:hypothetical protein
MNAPDRAKLKENSLDMEVVLETNLHTTSKSVGCSKKIRTLVPREKEGA